MNDCTCGSWNAQKVTLPICAWCAEHNDDAKADAKARAAGAVDELPDTCPQCGAKHDPFTTAVALTCYDGNQLQYDGATFQPDEPPEDQDVRAWCSSCDFYQPLTKALATELISQTGARD